jgi:hypothetical protein
MVTAGNDRPDQAESSLRPVDWRYRLAAAAVFAFALA